MNLKQFFLNPICIVIAFSMVLISQEHLGSFYFIYVFLGLPFRALHSLLGLSGMLIAFVNLLMFQKKKEQIFRVLNILTTLLFYASLIVFFLQDRAHYNYATFEQTVPLIFMSLFVILSIGFIVINIIHLAKKLA